jgi:hypothetical protein
MSQTQSKGAEASAPAFDTESESFLNLLADQERVRSQRVSGVRTVLVVLSSKGMVYDMESLRQKIVLAYPEAAVFFRTTSGQSVGVASPNRVDLLIDLTSPRSRQGWFYARKLRGMARHAVGRNAGLFRKAIFDRIFDEKAAKASVPTDQLERERYVQRQVLELAGVALAQMGDTPPDRGQKIALELPPMKRL